MRQEDGHAVSQVIRGHALPCGSLGSVLVAGSSTTDLEQKWDKEIGGTNTNPASPCCCQALG